MPYTLLNIITLIGIPVIIAGLIYIGRKLQILDDLQKTTNKIKTNIKIVSDFLVKNASNFDPSELQSYSPVTLTDVGKSFVKKIGFENVFEKHKQDFFQCIDSDDPKLKYDVELAAIKSVNSLYEKDYMDFLKVFFYNNPKRNIGNTAPTLGVYIRDKYLKEHPEITQ